MTKININIIVNNINNITTSTFRLSRSRSVLIAEPWPELEGAEQAEASGSESKTTIIMKKVLSMFMLTVMVCQGVEYVVDLQGEAPARRELH